MDYETIIGLEVHVQLGAQSKMFCPCAADYQAALPNSRVCPVCLGMPGTLPVINNRAVEYTIMTGLALNCQIDQHTKFDRKNYPYPDLMKGYQISQYDAPIAFEGFLDIEVESRASTVGITRVHLEEDVAKLQHVREAGESYSLMDVNRAGVPLMEVVSEPDMRSPEEAHQYLTSLHSIIRYLGVSTANMQDGSFRCDANVSIRPVGATELGAKVEVKNMNSFRAVHNALKFEVERQTRAVIDGERVVQETRGWVEGRNITVSQRSKEFAHDYRYFPEPDLPPLNIDPSLVESIRSQLPELPAQKQRRFVTDYGLPSYGARQLTASKATADYFEESVALASTSKSLPEGRAKSLSNWITVEMGRLMNLADTEISDAKVRPVHLVELLDMIDSKVLSSTSAKMVLEESFISGKMPADIVREQDYTQITDDSEVDLAVEEAIATNPRAVSDYLRGKETATKFLIGQVMKRTRGKANPAMVNDMMREKLKTLKTS